jgi:nucleoside-diphosphate-sugar epimerase
LNENTVLHYGKVAMSAHLVVGAGAVGGHAASALLKLGQSVTVATRSGTPLPGCTPIKLDASDAEAITAAARGHDSIVVCANPPYNRWPQQWPPIIDALVVAARETGARIVMMGNLYPYGRPDGVMTEQTREAPTEAKGKARAMAWSTLADASRRWGFPVTELRASDYVGPGAGANAHMGPRFIRPVRAGGTAWVVGDPDAVHSWSWLPDIGACLAALATKPDLSGRVWVGPNSGALSLREAGTLVNPVTGSWKIRQLHPLLLRVAGRFSPFLRELAAVSYQHTEPYVIDDTSLRKATGLVFHDLAEELRTLDA